MPDEMKNAINRCRISEYIGSPLNHPTQRVTDTLRDEVKECLIALLECGNSNLSVIVSSLFCSTQKRYKRKVMEIYKISISIPFNILLF